MAPRNQCQCRRPSSAGLRFATNGMRPTCVPSKLADEIARVNFPALTANRLPLWLPLTDIISVRGSCFRFSPEYPRRRPRQWRRACECGYGRNMSLFRRQLLFIFTGYPRVYPQTIALLSKGDCVCLQSNEVFSNAIKRASVGLGAIIVLCCRLSAIIKHPLIADRSIV